jgi:hypothetical protein
MKFTSFTVHDATVHGKVAGSLGDIAVADIRYGGTEAREDEEEVIDAVYLDVVLIERTSIIV